VERAEKRDGGPGRPPPAGRAGPPRGAFPRRRRFRAGRRVEGTDGPCAGGGNGYSASRKRRREISR
jgi:hypothetical protein